MRLDAGRAFHPKSKNAMLTCARFLVRKLQHPHAETCGVMPHSGIMHTVTAKVFCITECLRFTFAATPYMIQSLSLSDSDTCRCSLAQALKKMAAMPGLVAGHKISRMTPEDDVAAIRHAWPHVVDVSCMAFSLAKRRCASHIHSRTR